MTHNIVAQFSCSVYTAKDTAKNRIPSGKVQGDFKDYQVVNGSIFNEEYSETLDSATIVLSQVLKEDRLINIAAYQYVRIFDKSTAYNSSTGRYAFDKIYLVDTFDEEENNINEHIFGYTINLMSETKMLEKIQCPNLTITHKVVNGEIQKKTIYQYIKQYFELFVPKIKFCSDGRHWDYQPLIKLVSGNFHTENGYFEELDSRDFHVQGDELEVIAWSLWSYLVPGISPDFIDPETVEIYNVQIDRNIPFYSTTIFYDSTARAFKFNGIVRETQPDINWYARITFDFSFYDMAFFEKFDTPCADMSFNAPTLRQLLTALMQQVSCIPVVKNRALSYLDFKKPAVRFGGGDYTVNNTVNRIRRCLSSDSYANTLVNLSENVLDSGNYVYCEALGFRDIERALLKQKENLYLETKFPIYKVTNFVIHSYVKSNVSVNNIFPYNDGGVGVPGYEEIVQWSFSFERLSSNQVSLKLGMSMGPHAKVIVRGQLVAFKYNDSQYDTFTISETFRGNSFTPGVSDVITRTLSDSSYNFLYFSGSIRVSDLSETYASFTYNVFYQNIGSSLSNLLTLYTQDITPLLVEQSVRQNLSTDFLAMAGETDANSNANINTLAKYVYGTVGYSIGSKKISGFSEVFSVGNSTALGWIEEEYTYIENIWNFIIVHYKSSIESIIKSSFADIPIVYDYIYQDDNPTPVGGGENVSFSIGSITPVDPTGSSLPGVNVISTKINFGFMWFDITYQPLNSFNLAYTKSIEEVDYPVAQYDGNASGVSDFDRLSTNEQQQVDRIGNETLVINQRTIYSSELQSFDNGPLLFMDDSERDGDIDSEDNGIEYIVFKRSFTINNNCFNATYIGSKDAILKDYFTSIRTKYRAYQYVDYNQSIVRKERDTFFVKISDTGWYKGDDRVHFGEQSSFTEQRNRLSWLIPNDYYIFYNAFNNIVMAQSDAENQAIKYTRNDISKISCDNFIGFIYEDCDNVSAGTYLMDSSFDQKNVSVLVSSGGAFYGGVPQFWQMWDDAYYNAHFVGFYYKLDIANIFDSYPNISNSNVQEIRADFQKALQMPIVDTSLSYGKNIFTISDDNSDVSNKRTFYKDLSERINHTVQFIYYTDSENVLWGETFLKSFNIPLSSQAAQSPMRYIIDLTNQEFSIEKEPYLATGNTVTTIYNNVITYGTSAESNPYINVNWNLVSANMTQFKVVEYETIGGKNYLKDIVAFKKGDNNQQQFFITLNDTKSDYVMAERNGVLYRRYKVKKNTSSRYVDKLHDL